MPAMSVLQRIRAMLDEAGIDYRHVHHEAVRTSEQAARVRGEPLSIGGKALVVKIGDGFRLFVLSASLRLHSTAVRERFATRRIRFASAPELLELTGLVPGSVPPFGEPVLPLPLNVDPSVLANDRIAFNAGSLTDSIIMQTADYRTLAGGEVFPFAEAG
jgi:prolyl-tRNA editing enzyme YbaK/EbsC (Cys-tRNA(Pro) deacylase)